MNDNFLIGRSLQTLIALVAVLLIVFFLVRLTGDPAALYLPLDASLEERANFARNHGLDQPIIVQLGEFLSGLMVGDFGQSIRQARPAIDVVLDAYPTTLRLGAVTMVIAMLVAVALGGIAAYRPRSLVDRTAGVLSLFAASVPDFWIAISAITLFAVTLGWLPTSGTGGPAYWVMPVAVLLLRPLGVMIQVVRASMLDALSSAYVKTARAKGVGEHRVIYVHALRNAFLPVLTVAGDQAVAIANGAVIVETVFGWPGIGRVMIDSVQQRDFSVVQAVIIVVAITVFTINLVIDLLYAWLDPRVRP
ncbi:ABC transporter permease [Oricola thermophila]|uniref:ABC transporter permease n=1 Tax=Oricola thermophila TaxID=2742145 RepID=A0A6N1VGB6_9HYPH|nr:ABC transporter permease [Oricola thermophila]QKV18302.1 ABC transporter permease [Oricola thermophila]